MREHFDPASTSSHQSKKRTPPLSVRMTPEEKDRVRALAAPMSVNAYARALLLDPPSTLRVKAHAIRKLDQAKLAGVLATLGRSRLSSNLNQIAKAAHMGILPVSQELADELSQACADVRLMRQTLIEALNLKPVQ